MTINKRRAECSQRTRQQYREKVLVTPICPIRICLCSRQRFFCYHSFSRTLNSVGLKRITPSVYQSAAASRSAKRRNTDRLRHDESVHFAVDRLVFMANDSNDRWTTRSHLPFVSRNFSLSLSLILSASYLPLKPKNLFSLPATGLTSSRSLKIETASINRINCAGFVGVPILLICLILDDKTNKEIRIIKPRQDDYFI